MLAFFFLSLVALMCVMAMQKVRDLKQTIKVAWQKADEWERISRMVNQDYIYLEGQLKKALEEVSKLKEQLQDTSEQSD